MCINQQRIKDIFKTGNSKTLTKYYLGKYEEEVVSGNTRKLHYIYGGNPEKSGNTWMNLDEAIC
jgi:hypothetical protein